MKKVLLFLLILNFDFFGQVNLDSGLVACYALNGNGYEPIHGLHGILSGATPSANRFNSANKSLLFSSPNASVELTNNVLFKTPAVSFSGWIKPAAGSTGYIVHTMNSFGSEAYSLSYGYFVNANQLQVKKCNNSFIKTLTSITSLTSNTWYHVCFSIDHDYLKIYVNGSLEDSLHAIMNFNYGSGQSIYIGDGFTGSIDNVRFYNRVITAAEITQLYNSDPACIASISPPVTSYSITSPLCVSRTVKFVDLSTNNPDSWLWQIPGGITSPSLGSFVYNSAEISPQYTFNTLGTYIGTLTTSNANGANTNTFTLVINSNPTVTAQANPTVVCEGLVVSLAAYGASSYTWSTNQNGSNVTATIWENTPFPFTVLGSDTNGCEGSATIQMQLVSDCGPSSISEIRPDEINVLVYPNPTKGRFSIDVSGEKIKEYEVVDLLGLSILKGKADSDKNLIDLGSYPDGIYFLKVRNEELNKTIKIVKE